MLEMKTILMKGSACWENRPSSSYNSAMWAEGGSTPLTRGQNDESAEVEKDLLISELDKVVKLVNITETKSKGICSTG